MGSQCSRVSAEVLPKLLGYLVQVYLDGHAWIGALSQRRRERREFVPPTTGVAPAVAGYRRVATACSEVAIVWGDGADRPRVKRIVLPRPQLTVNSATESKTASFGFPKAFSAAENVMGSRPATQVGQRVELSYEPLEVKIVRLTH
jgi:hypothetical protein